MSISAPKNRPKAKTRASLLRFESGQVLTREDFLATEEPLEIRLIAGGQVTRTASIAYGDPLGKWEAKTIAVTMRTPGHDFELAAGFLFAEGVIGSRKEIRQIAYCVDPEEPQQYNIVNVELKSAVLPEFAGLDRHFFTNSACGVCGKSGLENLHIRCKSLDSGFTVDAAMISSLPAKLRRSQALFDSTGGLHAAALFDAKGNLLAAREDVGRHNALDKLLGWAFLENKLPLENHLVLVSGRTSYELVQKALAARVPILAAISAPSSLAVDLAREFNLTLVGFLRESFNLYSGKERVLIP